MEMATVGNMLTNLRSFALCFCVCVLALLIAAGTPQPASAGSNSRHAGASAMAAAPLDISPDEGAAPPTASHAVPRYAARTSTKQRSAANTAKPEPEERYFVEFRSRTAQSYGHTFVVHGKVTNSKVILPSMVAGLWPEGGSAEYILGHVVPVPAGTGASHGDTDERYLTAKYRIEMGKDEYMRVNEYIKNLQASLHTWTATQQNCNWFAGEIAHFMGLKTPSITEMPKDYVNLMRKMNSRR
jgi:hypothetical protein